VSPLGPWPVAVLAQLQRGGGAGGDAGGQRNSEVSQITKDNVDDLEQAWEFAFNEPEKDSKKFSLKVTLNRLGHGGVIKRRLFLAVK